MQRNGTGLLQCLLALQQRRLLPLERRHVRVVPVKHHPPQMIVHLYTLVYVQRHRLSSSLAVGEHTPPDTCSCCPHQVTVVQPSSHDAQPDWQLSSWPASGAPAHELFVHGLEASLGELGLEAPALLRALQVQRAVRRLARRWLLWAERTDMSTIRTWHSIGRSSSATEGMHHLCLGL